MAKFAGVDDPARGCKTCADIADLDIERCPFCRHYTEDPTKNCHDCRQVDDGTDPRSYDEVCAEGR